jgi:hypothetical protein
VSLEAHGAEAEREVWALASRLAQEAARRMRELAPKDLSTLVNSIAKSSPTPGVWEIRPGVDYALYRETGTRPGKHLPMFGTPAAKGITDWLEKKAFRNAAVGPLPFARLRKNDKRRSSMDQQLRDRYNALSWHVRRKGTKATPFVAPTAREFEAIVPQRVEALVARLVARANGGTA